MDPYNFGSSEVSFEALGFLVPTLTTAVASSVLSSLGFGTIVLYVIARWRVQREGHADPHLGLKTALSLFRCLATQAALLGLFLITYRVLMPGDDAEAKGDTLRTGIGSLLAGAAIYTASLSGILRTNHRLAPTVGRLFAGANLVVTGLVGFFALYLAVVVSLQRDPGKEAPRLLWSLVIVYTTAALAQLGLFARRADVTGYGAPPAE